MKNARWRSPWWLLFTFLLCAVAACGAEHIDYSIDLINGYELVRANEHEIFISDARQQVVVPGKIIEYAVVGNAVVGLVKVPDWLDKDGAGLFNDVVEGYFLLDTSSKTRSVGLTLSRLHEELQKKGVEQLPAMKAPRRP